MADDIVERLRPTADNDRTVLRAADALRAEGFGMLAVELRRWADDNTATKSEAATEIESLRAERDRLREALRQIADLDDIEAALDPQWAINRANRALTTRNPEPPNVDI